MARTLAGKWRADGAAWRGLGRPGARAGRRAPVPAGISASGTEPRPKPPVFAGCLARALRANGWTAPGIALAIGLVGTPAVMSQTAHAGAWTYEAGTGQAILQGSAVTSANAFGPSSELFASRSFDKVEATLTFEYGLTDWLTLIAAPQLLYVDLGPPWPSSYAGPGYTDLGARARLWQGDGPLGAAVVSAQIVARLPGTGDSASAAAVGYQDAELDLRLLFGTSFMLWQKPAYLDLQIAQRQRFGDPPDELRFDATLGVRVAPRWQVLVQSFNVISEGAGEGPDFSASYEYYKLQLSGAYDLSAALTVQVGIIGTVFARNAPQETGAVASALYRF